LNLKSKQFTQKLLAKAPFLNISGPFPIFQLENHFKFTFAPSLTRSAYIVHRFWLLNNLLFPLKVHLLLMQQGRLRQL